MEKNTFSLEKKVEQALALQQNNKIDDAIAIFNEILSQNPNQPDALHGLGMAYAQQRNYSQAAQYLAQAVQAAPTVAEFHNNLGNAYQAVGKTDDALRHYHEALRLKGTYPQAHNNLGTLLYRLGKFDEAANHFQKSLRMNPHAIDTHYNLANCYIQLDRLLDSVAHYQEVLKAMPNHLGALHNLGITLCALKRYNEALPYLKQVCEQEPTNKDALFHLGIIYSSLAKANDAIACYERVIAIDPLHANAHHNLATVYLHLNDREKALKHYQEALYLVPNNKTAEHMVDALSGKTQVEGAPLEYTQALFDQYAYSYDSHVKEHLQYHVPQLLRDAIAPFVATAHEPWLVLDLGCGTGLCAPLFSDVAGKLIGVDVSPNMVEVARQRGGYYKLYTMDALTYLARHQSEFDLIISADVFVYFGSLEAIFQACYRALKPQGLFCFSIENLSIEEIKISTLYPDYQLRKTGRYAHATSYIETLSKASGFKIENSRTDTIRYQEEVPVEGNIYVLRKPM